MPSDRIGRELERLAGLRYVPADMGGHREVLGSVDPKVLTEAVGAALRECREFPTPAELLRYVDAVRVRAAALAPRPAVVEREIAPLEVAIPQTQRTVRVTREYEPECSTCADSGWQPLWCGHKDTMSLAVADRGALPNHCGRHADHQPHEFAVSCFCRPTNRTYQRKREQECAAARKRTDARQGA